MRAMLRLLLLPLLLAGCSAPKRESAVQRDTLTQRQRDSVLAKSSVPGSRAVGKALDASDAANSHNAAIDSANNQ